MSPIGHVNEFFIDCVRLYPCVWNTNHHSYKKLEVKDAAWQEIAIRTKMESASAAKSKWKNLRDTHREKIKILKKAAAGQTKTNIKPWRYMKQMDFLLPFTSTDRIGNMGTPCIVTSVGEAVAEVSTPKKRKTSKVIYDEEDTESNQGSEKIKQTEEVCREVTTCSRTNEDDSLKAFFDSMYQSTKKMPEFHKRLIKKELFQLVMDAEEKIASTHYSQYGYDYNSDPNETNNSIEHVLTDSPEHDYSDFQEIKVEENSVDLDEHII